MRCYLRSLLSSIGVGAPYEERFDGVGEPTFTPPTPPRVRLFRTISARLDRNDYILYVKVSALGIERHVSKAFPA